MDQEDLARNGWMTYTGVVRYGYIQHLLYRPACDKQV